MNEIRGLASEVGPLFDDFADASFSYCSIKMPHVSPWVGVFHHPVAIFSPLDSDRKYQLRRIVEHPHWEASRKHLMGAVSLCSESASDLRDWLNVPVSMIWHPTERDVQCWDGTKALEERTLVQAGFFLRNTQLIFQIAPVGWRRIQLFGATRGYRKRNRALQKLASRSRVKPDQVEILPRIVNSTYDDLLSRCVIVTEFYGAAANNLIVECMVRGTPIVTNRCPSVVEYLGADYPLFFDQTDQIPQLLEPSRLFAASSQLIQRSELLPSFKQFAQRVAHFVDSLSFA